MRRCTGWVVGLVVVASGCLSAFGCTSYTRTDRAQSQIAFGSEVARKGLWREAAFRFEQAIAKEPGNARAHNNQSALDLALTHAHHDVAGLLEELGAKLQ